METNYRFLTGTIQQSNGSRLEGFMACGIHSEGASSLLPDAALYGRKPMRMSSTVKHDSMKQSESSRREHGAFVRLTSSGSQKTVAQQRDRALPDHEMVDLGDGVHKVMSFCALSGAAVVFACLLDPICPLFGRQRFPSTALLRL